MLIDTQSGDDVRLGDIADVRVISYPTVIRHDATQRSLDVTAEVRGRDLGSVLQDVRDRVRGVPMPLEYHTEVISSAAQMQEQNLQTGGLTLAVIIGIFLLLQVALGSWRLAALALVSLPLSAAGGVLVAFLVGGIATLGVLLGLCAVLVISVRNTVVLINAYQAITSAGGARPDPDSVMRVTRERAGAILLTAVATIAVLMPVVVLGPTAGAEVLQPLAVVAVGGVITSVLLTLFVIPTLYLRLAASAPASQQA
jgi:Cu/Ag efflux pump CusA